MPAFKMLVLFASLLLLAACASGSTVVLEPPTDPVRYADATIEHGEDTVEVPVQAVERFEETLNKRLYAPDGKFNQGEGMTIRYRFLQLDEGSQAARYFIGFGAGKGQLTVEVLFLADDGREMARIHTGGEIIGGFFGGAFEQAIDRAAMETAEYANQYFAPTPASEADADADAEVDAEAEAEAES